MSDTPETDELSKGEHIAHPTVWSFCRKLERERDEAKEKLAVWKHEAEIVRAELKKTDDAFESNISTFIVMKRDNAELREQRDRLAKILKNIRSGYGGQMTDPDCGCEDCEFLIEIDKALQYLNPNEP